MSPYIELPGNSLDQNRYVWRTSRDGLLRNERKNKDLSVTKGQKFPPAGEDSWYWSTGWT